MKATELDVIDLLRASGAMKEGHFLLSSGLHSPAYVQCALLLQDAALAHRVGDALAQRLARLEPESVLAPALGGLIIGHETAAELGVPMRFTERQDGRMTLRRGFELTPGERLVVIEDVVTTGRSTREAIDVAEAHGAKVIAVGTILNRSGDPAGPFGGIPLFALADLTLPAWPPDDCPLCTAGGAAEKPGSRE